MRAAKELGMRIGVRDEATVGQNTFAPLSPMPREKWWWHQLQENWLNHLELVPGNLFKNPGADPKRLNKLQCLQWLAHWLHSAERVRHIRHWLRVAKPGSGAMITRDDTFHDVDVSSHIKRLGVIETSLKVRIGTRSEQVKRLQDPLLGFHLPGQPNKTWEEKVKKFVITAGRTLSLLIQDVGLGNKPNTGVLASHLWDIEKLLATVGFGRSLSFRESVGETVFKMVRDEVRGSFISFKDDHPTKITATLSLRQDLHRPWCQAMATDPLYKFWWALGEFVPPTLLGSQPQP